ncbi:MAG: Gfo/Idh/MocA family protein, partial [Gammaproteobacteria bacterium]
MSTSNNSRGDTVRLAVVGAGVIGKKHLSRIAADAGAELVAIVDPAPPAAELAAGYEVALFADAESMLSEIRPDGVVVATPTVVHLAPTLAALEAGAHVLVEKPIAATLEEAGQIVDASMRTGLPVLVGHQRRYYPLMARAREIIHGGEIGDLVALNGQWTMRKAESYLAPDWRKRRAAGPV